MPIQLSFDDPYYLRRLKANGSTPETVSQIMTLCAEICEKLDMLPLEELVETLNAVRHALHDHGPFATEPVDFVEWVPSDIVLANDYNPNTVAPVELELLRLSIDADGYTQPIVSNAEGDHREVVDGFHRHRVGKECADIQARIRGYLPLVQIRTSQADKGDRIASTIRHNRARGKHTVTGMSDIVMELKRRNWSDEKIGKQLGMEPDEVLRLAQITGLSIMFADRDFSEAWVHDGQVIEDGGETIDEVDLEWMNGMKQNLVPGWNDRTDKHSVLVARDGQRLGAIQKSRFDETWNWRAYTAPMKTGDAASLEHAKQQIEAEMGRVGNGKE